MFINRRIDNLTKLWHRHTVKFTSMIKTIKLLCAETWTKLKSIMLIKLSQIQKSTYILYTSIEVSSRRAKLNISYIRVSVGNDVREGNWLKGGVVLCLDCSVGYMAIYIYKTRKIYSVFHCKIYLSEKIIEKEYVFMLRCFSSVLLKVKQRQKKKKNNSWFMKPKRKEKGGREEDARTKGHESMRSTVTFGWKKYETLFPFLFSVFHVAHSERCLYLGGE